MSLYKDFVQDFPRRCEKVLDLAHSAVGASDLEVTLSLMAAAAGVLVAYERLRRGSRFGEHPSGDRKTHQVAASRLEDLLKQTFTSSALCGAGRCSWRSGRLASAEGDPDTWPELRNPDALSPATTVEHVLNIIRNALAHGNIYAKGAGAIQNLIFYTRNGARNGSPPYQYVMVSPEDFYAFLKAWLRFLGEHRI